MRRALKEIPEEPPESYGERIRDLVERNRIAAARALTAEAEAKGVREEGLETWRAALAPARVLGLGLVARESGRRLEELWIEKNAETYRGRWVVLEGDTLLAHAATFTELAEKIENLGPARNPLAFRFD